jgi:hypothetical protein
METLTNKFTELIGWERRKRREQTIAMVACTTLSLSLLFLPLNPYLPGAWLRWLVPLALFVVVAPWFFYRARWRRRDSARALVQLDKTLKLDARAVTAWELAPQAEPSGAALLVLKQAEEKLHDAELRALLPRQRSWTAYAALPLLALWLALLWLEFDRRNFDQARYSSPPTLAHKLREFSRELQDKAKNEGLRETLKLGQELEKTAQKSIDAKAADEQMKKELAAVAKKFATSARSTTGKDSFPSAESEQSLHDLKAELEATRDLWPDASSAAPELGQRWMERLAGMPQLKRQLAQGERDGQGLGPNELKSLVDKLTQQVAGELDRRSVIDAQKYLEQMMKQGQSEKGENYARSRADGEQDPTADGVKDKTRSNLPGKEPGKRDEENRSLPEFRSGASTQVKGLLGEGESSGLMLKGKPNPGKSAVSEAEVVATYRRQAEQELNSERVPEGLKETIKNYFMSLGEAKK